MNRDDILRMAEEAGLCRDDGVWYSRSDVDSDVATDDLERFAALVAAAEREACARVCEHMTLPDGVSGHGDWRRGADDCAAAIRARGEE